MYRSLFLLKNKEKETTIRVIDNCDESKEIQKNLNYWRGDRKDFQIEDTKTDTNKKISKPYYQLADLFRAYSFSSMQGTEYASESLIYYCNW